MAAAKKLRVDIPQWDYLQCGDCGRWPAVIQRDGGIRKICPNAHLLCYNCHFCRKCKLPGQELLPDVDEDFTRVTAPYYLNIIMQRCKDCEYTTLWRPLLDMHEHMVCGRAVVSSNQAPSQQTIEHKTTRTVVNCLYNQVTISGAVAPPLLVRFPFGDVDVTNRTLTVTSNRLCSHVYVVLRSASPVADGSTQEAGHVVIAGLYTATTFHSFPFYCDVTISMHRIFAEPQAETIAEPARARFTRGEEACSAVVPRWGVYLAATLNAAQIAFLTTGQAFSPIEERVMMIDKHRLSVFYDLAMYMFGPEKFQGGLIFHMPPDPADAPEQYTAFYFFLVDIADDPSAHVICPLCFAAFNFDDGGYVWTDGSNSRAFCRHVDVPVDRFYNRCVRVEVDTTSVIDPARLTMCAQILYGASLKHEVQPFAVRARTDLFPAVKSVPVPEHCVYYGEYFTLSKIGAQEYGTSRRRLASVYINYKPYSGGDDNQEAEPTGDAVAPEEFEEYVDDGGGKLVPVSASRPYLKFLVQCGQCNAVLAKSYQQPSIIMDGIALHLCMEPGRIRDFKRIVFTMHSACMFDECLSLGAFFDKQNEPRRESANGATVGTLPT